MPSLTLSPNQRSLGTVTKLTPKYWEAVGSYLDSNGIPRGNYSSVVNPMLQGYAGNQTNQNSPNLQPPDSFLGRTPTQIPTNWMDVVNQSVAKQNAPTQTNAQTQTPTTTSPFRPEFYSPSSAYASTISNLRNRMSSPNKYFNNNWFGRKQVS